MGWLKKAGAWLWKNKGKVYEGIKVIVGIFKKKKKEKPTEQPIKRS